MFPHVVVATRPLTAAEWQAVRQAGSVVVSLVADPAYSGPLIIGQPGMPSPSGLVQDAQALAQGNWKPGVYTQVGVPTVQIAQSALTVPSMTALQSLLQTADPSRLNLLNTWNALPAPVRTTWSQWVNLGNPAETL